MKTFRYALGAPLGAAVLVLVLAGCGGDAPKSGPTTGHDHSTGPHQGALAVWGDHQHLEVVHDGKAGVLKLWFIGADAKTAVAPPATVKVNFKSDHGPVQVLAKPVPGELGALFATHADLKDHHVSGQVTFEMGGKPYVVALPDCDHDHEKGHDGDHEQGGESTPTGDAKPAPEKSK